MLLRTLFLSLVGAALCWIAGLWAFMEEITTAPHPPAENADAIVVLTGGEGRLEGGLSLLADGKAELLFITGVGKGATVSDLLSTVSPALRQRVSSLPPGRIELGHRAENTIGNAEETKEWVARNHLESLILVTAHYHMPRARVEFAEILPAVRLDSFAVSPNNPQLERWWTRKADREMILSEYHKFLAAKARHWIVEIVE